MLFPKRLMALAAPISFLLCYTLVEATPMETPAPRYPGLGKRQDNQTNNIQWDADTDPDVSIDNTEKMRNAVDASKLYTNLETQTYSQIKIGPSPTDASFTVYTTASQGAEPSNNPPSEDPQGKAAGNNGKNKQNIDHILELQMIGFAFTSANQRPTSGANSIGESAWKSVSSAVNGADSAGCTAIAKKITVADNLEAIPQQVNGFKQQVFTGRLKNQPGNPSDKTYYSDFGPAVQKVLKDRQTDMFSLMGTIGDELQSIGEGQPAVKNYFTSYAQPQYSSIVEFLSSWTGKTYPTSTTTTSAKAAAVTCNHAADPQNTCAAVANGPGWCDCADGTTYAVMPTGDPCAYSTQPVPTTSFNCPASAPATPTPTPAPSQVNQGCYSGKQQGPFPQASFARTDALSVISSVCSSERSNTILASGSLSTGGVDINLSASQEDPNAPAFSTDTCEHGFEAAMDNCDTGTVTGKFGGTVTIGGIDYQIFADVPTKD